MGKGGVNFELEGMDEIVVLLNKLGDMPGKLATVSAKEGAQIALADAKSRAPIDDGNLRKGIVLVGEKKPYASKKVYRITMNPKMNDVFVRMVNGNRYYYPASIEFGFIGRDGKKTRGVHFMEYSLTMNNDQIEKTILRRLLLELEKVTK